MTTVDNNATANQTVDPEQTRYADLNEFVTEFLGTMYRRQVSDQHDTAWCPDWWRHPEAVSRLEALWRAFEHLRKAPGLGMSVWWLDHADKHMARLFDPQGPFKYCSARNGHKDMLIKLPTTPPPNGLLNMAKELPGR